MGNKFNLGSGCVQPSELCTNQFNVQQVHPQSLVLKKKRVKSTDQIKEKIIKYVQQNRLQLYPIRQKKLLQSLVSVDQQHVSDKIISMDKQIKFVEQQKRQQQRKQKNQHLLIQNNSKTPTTNSQQSKEKTQQLSSLKINKQLQRLKLKRKKLFQQAQCLLLEDLDMILQQIPYFDQNYHLVNSILSLSQTLKNKSQQNHPNQSNQNKIITQLATNLLNKTQIQNSQQIQRSSTIHYEEEKPSSIKSKILHPLQYRTEKKEKQYEQRLRETIRMEDKNNLKKNVEIGRLGMEVLRENQLLMIIPIQCFSGIGALQHNTNTGLPSGATLFQLLANKIKAVNMRRNCTLGLVFLVNKDFIQQFKQQIHKTVGFQDYTQNDKLQINSNISNLSEAHNNQSISYHIIGYRNIWPTLDQSQRILLSDNDNNNDTSGIAFTKHDGDLIGFIQDNMQLKQLIQKYDYIHFTNPNNMLSQIGDIYAIGFLQMNQQLDVIVKLLKPNDDSNQLYQLKDHFNLNFKGFVDIIMTQKQQFKSNHHFEKQQQRKIKRKICCTYEKNQPLCNIEEYYVRSRIFTTDSGPLKRLLMSRVTRRVLTTNANHQQSSVNFYLHRSLSSIFYSKFTAFLLVQEENEFSLIQTPPTQIYNHLHMNGHIGYSRFCKKLLGLRQSEDGMDQEEMVQIDGGILHKGSEELKKILKELKKIKEVGFPIILYSNLFNNEKQN